MLNSIGLDNDGIEAFIAHHLPYLAALGVPIIVSIAGQTHDEFVAMARRLDGLAGIAAVELNISCPNVSGGVDFGTDPAMCERVVADCRARDRDADHRQADAERDQRARDREGGGRGRGGRDFADQHVPGHGDRLAAAAAACWATSWAGLSGPAIKPIALRAVFQAAQAVETPIIGIGGIATIDDVMEFLVAGATAVQLGTVNFYNPKASMEVLDALPAALAEAGASGCGVVGLEH